MKRVLLSAQNVALILGFLMILVGEFVTECLHFCLKKARHKPVVKVSAKD